MLQLLWVKLLCLAGKQGKGGVFLLKEGVPYTPRMLSVILRMAPDLVERGLDLFREYGMVEDRQGAIAITNWNTHQSMTAYEKKLAYDREYRRKEKEQTALHKDGLYGCDHNVKLTDAQFITLQTEYPQDYQTRIDSLSTYMTRTGRIYADPMAVIRKWAKEGTDHRLKNTRSFAELSMEDL